MSYKKSRVYQLGYELVLQTEELCRNLPSHERYALAQQLRNSSRSVVATYVEGYIRQGLLAADYRRFLIYSQGSCDESKYWLELARDLGLVEENKTAPILTGYQEITRCLVSMIRGQKISTET